MGKLIAIVAIPVVIAIFLAGWTETNLEWWLTLLTDKPVDVPYFLAFILTFFTNVFGIVFNVATEIFKLVL